jgi:hypothetical protein
MAPAAASSPARSLPALRVALVAVVLVLALAVAPAGGAPASKAGDGRVDGGAPGEFAADGGADKHDVDVAAHGRQGTDEAGIDEAALAVAEHAAAALSNDGHAIAGNSHAHEPVRDNIKDAHSLKERLLLVEKLLKLKEAQVRDAVDTSKYYTDAYKANIEKIKKLNRLVETSRKGGKAILADLEKERKVERDLRDKLEKDEEMLAKLENALNSAEHAASDPALSQWIRRRVESLAVLIQDEPSAKALGRVVGEVVEDTRDSVYLLESEVEQRVRNKGLAILACVIVVLLPALVVRWALSRVTKALSYRQHVLIGNLFNFILLSSLIGAIVIFRNDPMVTIRKLSPHNFIIVQAFFVVQWPVMMFLLLHTSLTATSNQDRVRYIVQLVVFISIIVHVVVVSRVNVLFSAAKSESNLVNYAIYNMGVAIMLGMTLTGPRTRQDGLVSDVSDMVQKGVGEAVHLAAGGVDSFLSKPDIDKRRFIRLSSEDQVPPLLSYGASHNGSQKPNEVGSETKTE